MKSVKCPECGFVGWADAECCKKCGVLRMPDPPGDSYQPASGNPQYHSAAGGYSDGNLKKGLAVASLVIGILNFFTLGLLGVGVITGIVLAVVALNKAKRNPYEYGGQSLATAGLIMSIISAVIIVPIGIVAAIAIPNLLAARRAANEGAALAALRTIYSAEMTHQATNGNGQFTTLEELASQKLIRPQLASGSNYGYKFTVEVVAGYANAEGYAEPGFQLVAVPLTYGSTGIRSFYLDETGVIRGEDARGMKATALTPALNLDGYSSSSPPSIRYRESEY